MSGCEGRGVPARDCGDTDLTDLFDGVPAEGLRWPGGGVPFSDLAASIAGGPFASNKLCDYPS